MAISSHSSESQSACTVGMEFLMFKTHVSGEDKEGVVPHVGLLQGQGDVVNSFVQSRDHC